MGGVYKKRALLLVVTAFAASPAAAEEKKAKFQLRFNAPIKKSHKKRVTLTHPIVSSDPTGKSAAWSSGGKPQ